jgi:hypothetical protein
MLNLRCALVVLSFLNSAIAFSQEPASGGRPERFVMLLKPGDKVSWSIGTGISGYRMSVYPETRFAEMVNERAARQEEMKTIANELKGQSRSINSRDVDSKDPETQRRVQNIKRLEQLRSAVSGAFKIGTVTFVGQDYIAVVANDDESRELLIPAWNIAQISRWSKRKE